MVKKERIVADQNTVDLIVFIAGLGDAQLSTFFDLLQIGLPADAVQYTAVLLQQRMMARAGKGVASDG